MGDPLRCPRGEAGFVPAHIIYRSVFARLSCCQETGLALCLLCPLHVPLRAQHPGLWPSGNRCRGDDLRQSLPLPGSPGTFRPSSSDSICDMGIVVPTVKTRKLRLREAYGCVSAGPSPAQHGSFQAAPHEGQWPLETSAGRASWLSRVMGDPGRNQHQRGGKTRQEQATCCLTHCPCCWPRAPRSYETITYEPRQY